MTNLAQSGARPLALTHSAPQKDSRRDAPVSVPELPSRADRLRAVTALPSRLGRPKIAHIVVIIAGIAAIVTCQLLLSVALSDGAYQISALQGQQKELDRSNQALTEQLSALDSPQNLVQNAEGLGMIANGATAYLRLSDGAILGSPLAATTANTPITSGGGSLVGNSLLGPQSVGVPAAAVGGAVATDTSVSPSAPQAPAAEPELPLQGGIPAPSTR